MSTRAQPVGEPPTLRALARAHAWQNGQPERELLIMVRRRLESRPTAKVAVIGGRDAEAFAAVLRARFPGLRTVCADPRADSSQFHVALSTWNPYHLVVDLADGDAALQVETFRRTFYHLGRGADYLARRLLEPSADATGGDLPPSLRELLGRARTTEFDRADPETIREIAVLGRHLGREVERGEAFAVRNRGRVRPKLRDHEINPIMLERPEIGELLETRPGLRLQSRSVYEDGPGPQGRPVPHDPLRFTEFDVPPLYLRRYDQPVCGRGQVVEKDGLLMPDTYRHHLGRRLTNMYVNDVSPLFGHVWVALGEPRDLEGAYFHFDSEWPGHFGHTMTEQISRLWAWEQVKAREPRVKLLTTLPKNREDQRLQDWELALLGAYGVQREDVTVFDEAVRPERLYAATPTFSCPEYVHPEAAEIWRRIGRHLAAQAPERERPTRLFVSRRAALKRACRNVEEVEEFFARRGFTVVYPEDHPMSEQAALFRSAETVAGFAGSGLFSMAFSERPLNVIMILPESYTARNEHLYASMLGHRMFVAWAQPDVPHPPGQWSVEAFASSFVVDLAHEGVYMDKVIARLENGGIPQASMGG